MKKSDWYKHLLNRVDEAIENEYYFEASFICYGIIEDRLNSMMKKNKLKIGFKGVAKKIKDLVKINENSFEQAFFLKNWNSGEYQDKGVFQDILSWGEIYRKPMQHSLGDPKEYKATIGDFHTENSRDMAIEGKRVARELSASIMRWKKIKKKELKVLT